MRRIIGIDPGKTGAIAVLDERGEIVAMHDMPVVGNQVSGTLLADIIDDVELDNVEGSSLFTTAIVERVHSMPRQGVASTFDFGVSYGIVLGVFSGARIRTENPLPTRWKKAMRLTADKELSRRRAIERWPGDVERFKRKMDADRAEAALLALWFIEQEVHA